MNAHEVEPKHEECPACGGAGGGPFGRANSAWDIESYECPRCEGWGYLRAAAEVEEEPPVVARPGIVKTTPAQRVVEKKKRRAGA
jgi:ribosomal protein S27AE